MIKMNKLLNLLNDKSNRIEGLDLIRAIAITLVLFYHAWIFLSPFFPNAGMLFFLGFWGVEIFFVLSGFLVGGALIKLYLNNKEFQHDALWGFWKKRWIRTIPIYLFCLILNYIVLKFFIGLTIEFPYKYFFFLQNFTSKHPSFFPEAWSLSIEEWFYIILPLIFFYNKPSKTFNSILYSILLLIGIYTLIRALNTNLKSFDIVVWDASVRKVVINRLDSILYGVLAFVFIYFKEAYIKKHRYWLLIISAIGVMISYLIFHLKINIIYNQVFFISTTSFFFSLSLPFFYFFKFNHQALKNIVLYISLISYSLYLTHYTLIFRLMNTYILADTLSKAIATTTLYVLISIVFSTIIYLLIEKKFIDIKNRIK